MYDRNEGGARGHQREGVGSARPFSTGGLYVNEIGGDDGRDRIQQAFGVNYARLATIKAKYDPANLFRLNANIEPAAVSSSQ